MPVPLQAPRQRAELDSRAGKSPRRLLCAQLALGLALASAATGLSESERAPDAPDGAAAPDGALERAIAPPTCARCSDLRKISCTSCGRPGQTLALCSLCGGAGLQACPACAAMDSQALPARSDREPGLDGTVDSVPLHVAGLFEAELEIHRRLWLAVRREYDYYSDLFAQQLPTRYATIDSEMANHLELRDAHPSYPAHVASRLVRLREAFATSRSEWTKLEKLFEASRKEFVVSASYRLDAALPDAEQPSSASERRAVRERLRPLRHELLEFRGRIREIAASVDPVRGSFGEMAQGFAQIKSSAEEVRDTLLRSSERKKPAAVASSQMTRQPEPRGVGEGPLDAEIEASVGEDDAAPNAGPVPSAVSSSPASTLTRPTAVGTDDADVVGEVAATLGLSDPVAPAARHSDSPRVVAVDREEVPSSLSSVGRGDVPRELSSMSGGGAVDDELARPDSAAARSTPARWLAVTSLGLAFAALCAALVGFLIVRRAWRDSIGSRDGDAGSRGDVSGHGPTAASERTAERPSVESPSEPGSQERVLGERASPADRRLPAGETPRTPV